MWVLVSKEQACSSDQLVVEGDLIVLRILAKGQSTFFAEQLGCVPEVVECYIQGLSGHNTENLTANHIGAMCWERCLIPGTLKNPALVIDWSRILPLLQEAILGDPILLSVFPVAIKICQPCYPCVPSHFSFHHHFMFITQIQLKYCCFGDKHQSINQLIRELE